MSDRRPRLRASLAPIFLLLAAIEAHAGPDADPTRPPSVAVDGSRIDANGTASPLELQAVFYAEGRRVAIIDGERLRNGDRVRSARVARIERDRVVLVRDGERIELVLVDADVKRPSPAPRTAEHEHPAPALPALPAAIAAPEEGSNP